jgi:hypothetical protein
VSSYAHLALTADPFADDTDLPDSVRWLHRHLRRQYHKAGAPYGETLEGLRRWLED